MLLVQSSGFRTSRQRAWPHVGEIQGTLPRSREIRWRAKGWTGASQAGMGLGSGVPQEEGMACRVSEVTGTYRDLKEVRARPSCSQSNR